MEGRSSIQTQQETETQRQVQISTQNYEHANSKKELMEDASGVAESLEAKTNLENYCHYVRENLLSLKNTSAAVLNEFGHLGKHVMRISEWLKVNSRVSQNEYIIMQPELTGIVDCVYARVFGHV